MHFHHVLMKQVKYKKFMLISLISPYGKKKPMPMLIYEKLHDLVS